MSVVPENTPGAWNTAFLKGATWPAVTIEMERDGSPVIPDSAQLLITDSDGAELLTVDATIDGGGVMTVGPLTDTETAALDWAYGNLVFRTTENDGTVTDLLAGNATVRNYGEDG